LIDAKARNADPFAAVEGVLPVSNEKRILLSVGGCEPSFRRLAGIVVSFAT
jgi:hypothetical protein